MDSPDHAGSTIICGSTRFIKKTILDYCFTHFDEEQIWLIDSLQIFDPYYLSSVDVSRTRAMLHAIRVARPFTLYQLHDKIHSLTRVPLDDGLGTRQPLGIGQVVWSSQMNRSGKTPTIIISGMDCFLDEAPTAAERNAITDRMIGVLARLNKEKGAAVLMGCRTDGMRERLYSSFHQAQVWNEIEPVTSLDTRPPII